MASRVMVATACDEHHDALAGDLLASLNAIEGRDFAIGFVRMGAAPVPAAIAAIADAVVSVAADPDGPGPDEGFQVAYLGVKNRLPEFFPDFDTYVWVDGDAWVQNVAGLRQAVAAAQHADFAAASETDGNYYRCLSPNDYALHSYGRLYGHEEARRLTRVPMINSGVVAARAGSPVWAEWSAALTEIRQRQAGKAARFFCDQIPLHRLMAIERLTLHPLRAVNNWLVLFAPPLVDMKGRLLRAPTVPFEEINILHLASTAKTNVYQLQDGSGRNVSFTYSGMRRLFDEGG